MAESNAFTDALENDIIDYYFRNQASGVGHVTTIYVALVTAVVAEDDTGATITEVADASGYARQAVVFTAASGGTSANNADVVFTASGGDWGTVVGIALVDSGTHGAGNVLMFDNSMTDVTVNDGDTLTFATGDIDISVT